MDKEFNLPTQAFDVELIKAVREYHDWHGDKNVKLVAFVCDPIGEPLLLTRVTDEHGKEASCLLEFYWDGLEEKFDVKEYTGGNRDNEYCMCAMYMGSCDNGV